MNLKIISGGQTGVDRAALDWAIGAAWPHGGWCPKGRLAEDGIIPTKYDLAETPSSDPSQRTEWNVRDSDGTVVFSLKPRLGGGSQLTLFMTAKYRKPLLHLIPQSSEPAKELKAFIDVHRIKVLNVAGSRESEELGVGSFVR